MPKYFAVVRTIFKEGPSRTFTINVFADRLSEVEQIVHQKMRLRGLNDNFNCEIIYLKNIESAEVLFQTKE